MKKTFLLGFISGAIILGIITSFAATYTALTASFPIFIDGEIWKNNKPTVVIDGSTYLPLKAIGDTLDVNVNWDSTNNRVEIYNTNKSKLFVYNWCTEVIDEINNYWDLRLSDIPEKYKDTYIENLERSVENLKFYKLEKDLFFYHFYMANIETALKETYDTDIDVEEAYESFIILLSSFEEDLKSVKYGGTNKINSQAYLDAPALLSIIRIGCTTDLY